MARESVESYLIQGVMVVGQNLFLAGPPKSGKTKLSADVAVSLGSGTPFPGEFDVPEAVLVLMLSGESGEKTLRRYHSVPHRSSCPPYSTCSVSTPSSSTRRSECRRFTAYFPTLNSGRNAATGLTKTGMTREICPRCGIFPVILPGKRDRCCGLAERTILMMCLESAEQLPSFLRHRFDNEHLHPDADQE
jgi:hypothetical protein